jgi:hypothetical protein
MVSVIRCRAPDDEKMVANGDTVWSLGDLWPFGSGYAEGSNQIEESLKTAQKPSSGSASSKRRSVIQNTKKVAPGTWR